MTDAIHNNAAVFVEHNDFGNIHLNPDPEDQVRNGWTSYFLDKGAQQIAVRALDSIAVR